ncbi:MAG TPA: hypothetical protein DCY13_22790 [Verrucomicrobiales bacterium]|nr:hypothetical protein [Verrucomicrobiales bacterium]
MKPLQLAALMTCLAIPASAAEPPRWSPGIAFPELVLPSISDGQARSLAEFRGQKLMLHIFASW